MRSAATAGCSPRWRRCAHDRTRAAAAARCSSRHSLVASAQRAQAEPVADFYRGKTIEILIGGAVGGGYDLAGRTVANHMGRHIPGNPGIVVRNMPGATSLIMTNQLYNVAKRDGTVIGMPTHQHSARAAAEADLARRRAT